MGTCQDTDKVKAPVQGAALELHIKTCMSNGIRWANLKADCKSQSSDWFCVLTKREEECLAFTQLSHDQNSSLVTVDVSQSIDRLPVSKLEPLPSGGTVIVAPTLLPSSKVWLWFQGTANKTKQATERLLTGFECFMLQGWPGSRQDLWHDPEFSEPFLQDLAGNAMTANVLLAVLASGLCCAEWEQETEVVEENTNMELLSSLL